MKNCPKCNALNNDENKFCEICGAMMDELESTTVINEAPAMPEPPVAQQPQYQAPVAPPVAPQPQYQAPVAPPVTPQPQYQAPVATQPVVQTTFVAQPVITEEMLPEEFKPATVGQYIGYSLLFSIPLIGFIMLFVIAFGSSKRKSLRNFAKSILLIYLISFVIAIVLVVLFNIAYWI